MSQSIDFSQSILYPKWFGGSASCMAVLVSHPLDLSKPGHSKSPKTILINHS